MSSQKRELIRKAINQNCIDHGKKGLDHNGNLLDGFSRLPDGRIIRNADLKDTPTPSHTDINDDQDLSGLRDLRGIGTNADGSLRNGFLMLQSGKVVSIKQYKAYRNI